MSAKTKQAKSIFLNAVENYQPDQWQVYLDDVCGDDADLRARVEQLLKAHADLGTFQERDSGFQPTAYYQTPSERSGTVIGPYKILQEIGEGGFGVVYMAEQHKPVKRRVALKIIKPGMDTHEVVARFEAERQALALMDHPNIARVLDAGATESGRPYFVMELVRGIPITEYCDKNNLTTRQRLTLFMDVCHAVQHAHQKGVIHRDLKPSNVLITLYDGEPVTKVIDFGVSKAINQQLTEKTLFTAFGQMVGTPQYMSPEQAEMSGLDIDTRSDIYSLGVLLYELMTGTTPLDGKRLRELGYMEMQRAICEEEPPRPSTRISTLGEQATSIAKQRSADVKRLREQLSGELDWMVMKSLDKDRGRRYETANAFASDVRRFLQNEAVEACPPSTVYRLRKFAARNKAIALTVAAIALLLVGVTALNTGLAAWAVRAERVSEDRRLREAESRAVAVRARQGAAQQRKLAETQRDKAKTAEMQAAAQREVAQAAEKRAQSNFQQARRAVDQYLQTVSESELLFRPGMQPLRGQLLESARTFYQTFLDQQDSEQAAEPAAGKTSEKTPDQTPDDDTATARYRLARILEEQGNLAAAESEYRAVRPNYEQLVAQGAQDHELQLELVDICRRLGDLKSARQHCDGVLAENPDHAAARRALAGLHEAAARQDSSQGQLGEALSRYEQAERIRSALTTTEEPSALDLADLAQTHYAMAQILLRQQRREDALDKYRAGVAAAERARDLDSQTPRYGQLVAAGVGKRAATERALEQSDEALRSYQRAVSAWSKMVFEFPAYAHFKAQLARAYRALADYQRWLDRGEDANRTDFRLEQFLSQLPRSLPADHYQLAAVYAQLALPAAAEEEAELSEAVTAHLPGYAEKAVEELLLAVQSGYRYRSGLMQDPLLKPLLERDDFRRVLQESQQKRATTGGPGPATSTDLPHHLLMIASLRGVAAAHRKLGQWDAARTTLQQCLTELDQQRPGDAAAKNAVNVERGKTQYAIGHLDWESRRYPEAKQAWDRGFQLLQQAHDQAKEEKKQLAQAIAIEEWQLIIIFGQIAFWDEAARHRANYVKFGRYMNGSWEHRIALITLVADEGKHYEDACRYLHEHFAESNPTDVAYALALGKQDVLAPEQLLELASQKVTPETQGGFARTVLGVCQVRGGNPKEALDNIDFNGAIGRFHRARALQQMGEHADAALWFQIGELEYAESARVWLASTTLRSPESTYWNWWELAAIQTARNEAWELIHKHPAPGGYARLFEARGWALVGDVAKSEAAFAEVVDRANEDPPFCVASAETRAVLGQHDKAERLFAQALEMEPANPRWWIARGKYYLDRGLDAQADADMMRAAELSKDDLDIFVRSGWWAVGPYTQDMSKSSPPEDSPHPSRPVARTSIDAQKGFAPRRWTRVPVNQVGNSWQRVDLEVLTGSKSNVSAYAMTYVYSPDDRTATLCLAQPWPHTATTRATRIQVWANGRNVMPATEAKDHWEVLDRIPVAFKAGRNQILVRVSTPARFCGFILRLGDSPLEQGLLAARLGRWNQAVQAFQKLSPQRFVRTGHLWAIYCGCLAAVGDEHDYDAAVATEFAYRRHTKNDLGLAELFRAGTLRPSSTMTPEVLLQIVEDLGEPTRQWQKVAKGRALFRAGEFQQVIDYYNSQQQAVLSDWRAQAVLTMAHHQLGHETDAQKWFKKIEDRLSAWSVQGSGWGVAPGSFARFIPLMDEARLMMRGVPPDQDPTWQSFRENIDGRLEKIEPETADYDLALTLEPKLPRLWIARAQRYAALSRWADAERDFNQAISLDGNNVRTWLASARYWVQRGDIEKARDAYVQLIRLDRGLTYRDELLKDLKENEPLFLAVIKTRDRDRALWQARGLQLCEEKRWADAAQVWKRLIELGSPNIGLMYQLALLQTASGDTSGYASTCGQMIKRHAEDDITSSSYLSAWACILTQGACDDYAPVLDLARRCRDRFLVSPSSRVTFGAALLRAGQSQQAIDELEHAGRLAADDDNPIGNPPAYAWYLLAMAHSRLGNDDAARQWHEKARHWTQQQLEAQAERVTRWNRQLTLELLERESAALLDDATASAQGAG